MSALQIPEQCGVMLLPDCTLFPHGGLPLFIFEQRYREMLDAALQADCLFAVTRLVDEEDPDISRCAAPIGTIGLVRASREQADGNSQLLLQGVIRVRFLEWLEGRSFPFAHIEPVVSEAPSGKVAEAMTLHLRDAVEEASVNFPDHVREALLQMMERTDDPVILADIISQQFIQDPDERQKMLETESLSDRVARLCQLLGEEPSASSW
jgi:Lon protease-like protein